MLTKQSAPGEGCSDLGEVYVASQEAEELKNTNV